MIIKDILLSITLIGAVIIPTWLLIRASGETRRFLSKELIRLNQTLPDTNDIWGQRAIAMSVAKRLIFIDLAHHQEEVLDLKNVLSCYLLLNKNKYTGGSIDLKKVSTFDLVVSSPGKLTNFSFYDSNVDDPVEGGAHVVMAKKWQGIIRGAIEPRI